MLRASGEGGGGVVGVGVDSFSHPIVFKKASPTLLKICLRVCPRKSMCTKNNTGRIDTVD